MRLSLVLFILLTVSLATTNVFAEPYRRLVNFEWEAIEGANAYDLELKAKKKDGKTYKFKIKDAAWNGRLPAGDYEMRLRALDYRGVPGDWSETSVFNVGLESVPLIHPAAGASVGAKDANEIEMTFRWKPVGGAVAYDIEVRNEDGSFKKTERLEKTELKLELPVARAYTWKVTAVGNEDIRSEAESVAEFKVIGPKIAKPVLEKPENEFVREVRWSKPENVAVYDVTVSRLGRGKKWEKVQEFTDTKDESVPFDAAWDGGTYRVDVKAKGENRLPSDPVSGTFKVRKGDRSPAAEFNAEVRKSIDRINGWYAIASYLVTVVKYSSSNYDPQMPVGTSYSAVGGTGRLGLGHFKEDRPWGFLGIVDMSGFVNDTGKNLTYTSSELSAVHRLELGERGEFRTQMGVYFKEHQVALGDLTNGSVSSYEKAAVAGPHLGGEYWYSLTPKIGFQMNAHLYLGLVKMKTPNNQPIDPNVSTQMGFLGSYRFNRRFTGLMGYARREDIITYKSDPTDGRYAGQNNKAELKGDYLNFFAEFAF